MDVILYNKTNKLEAKVNRITPWINEESFDGEFVHVIRAYGQLASNGAANSALIKTEPNGKYTIKASGAFNRFIIYGCDGNEIGDNVSEAIYSEITELTEKEYVYYNTNNYKYLLITLSYDYSYFHCNLSVIYEKHFRNSKNVSTLNYVFSSQKISNGSAGKIAYCEMKNGCFYEVSAIGTFNRYILGMADSVAVGTDVEYIYNSGNTNKRVNKTETYSFTSENAKKYLVLFYNYDNASVSDATVEIKETVMDGVFSVNGEQVYTAEQIDNIIENQSGFLFYTSGQNITLPTQSSAVFDLFDGLVTDFPDYVEKTTLGTDSNNKTVYEYQFGSGQYNSRGTRDRDTASSKPVILFISGVHGYERSAVMSTYEFFADLCSGNAKLCYLRENYIFKVIPMVCPDEYDRNERTNKNAVNINRNFDADWEEGGSGTGDYSGAAAADQPETQIVQDWIDDNTDAILFVDHHNSGYASEVSYLAGNNNVQGMANLKEAFIKRGYELKPFFVNVESFDDDLIYAYTGDFVQTGMSYKYAVKKGLLGVCLETSWNQNDTGKHSNTTLRAGADVVGNMLNAFVGK